MSPTEQGDLQWRAMTERQAQIRSVASAIIVEEYGGETSPISGVSKPRWSAMKNCYKKHGKHLTSRLDSV